MVRQGLISKFLTVNDFILKPDGSQFIASCVLSDPISIGYSICEETEYILFKYLENLNKDLKLFINK